MNKLGNTIPDSAIILPLSVDGGMLMTKFTQPTIYFSRVNSAEQEIQQVSCLRFMYTGNLVYLKVSVNYTVGTQEGLVWRDDRVNLGFSDWRPGQVHICSFFIIFFLLKIPLESYCLLSCNIEQYLSKLEKIKWKVKKSVKNFVKGCTYTVFLNNLSKHHKPFKAA